MGWRRDTAVLLFLLLFTLDLENLFSIRQDQAHGSVLMMLREDHGSGQMVKHYHLQVLCGQAANQMTTVKTVLNSMKVKTLS